MKKLIALTLALFTFAGCTTVPMDFSKPLRYDQGFFQQGFTQNGEFVKPDQARLAIQSVSAAEEKYKSAQAYQWGALGMIVGGVAVCEITIANSDRAFSTGAYWVGLGAILGSIPFSITAHNRFQEAAEEYNGAKFTIQPKTSFYLSPVRDGGLAGLQVQF